MAYNRYSGGYQNGNAYNQPFPQLHQPPPPPHPMNQYGGHMDYQRGPGWPVAPPPGPGLWLNSGRQPYRNFNQPRPRLVNFKHVLFMFVLLLTSG